MHTNTLKKTQTYEHTQITQIKQTHAHILQKSNKHKST